MILKRTTRIIILILTVICFTVCTVFGQGPGFDEDVEDTPIDGGVTLVLAVAAGYGAKKISDAKKKIMKLKAVILILFTANITVLSLAAYCLLLIALGK